MARPTSDRGHGEANVAAILATLFFCALSFALDPRPRLWLADESASPPEARRITGVSIGMDAKRARLILARRGFDLMGVTDWTPDLPREQAQSCGDYVMTRPGERATWYSSDELLVSSACMVERDGKVVAASASPRVGLVMP